MGSLERAEAVIVMTSGQITQIAPPAASNPYNNGSMVIWEENTSPHMERFDTDSPTPGTVPAAPAAYQVPLSPGSLIEHSYFVHMRPDTPSVYSGSITFDKQIVGVYTSTAGHNATDYLGFPATDYSPVGPMETNDLWSISADGRTITLNWRTNGRAYDQMRILILPEPSRAILLLFGVFPCLITRRR